MNRVPEEPVPIQPRLHVLRLLVLPAVMLWVLSGDHPTHAAPITVTTNTDARAGDGLCSLREAIMAANTDTPVDACAPGSGADEISVPPGTYLLTNAGPLDDMNRSGDLDISAELTIRGADPATTIIDGAALDRVFHIVGSITVEISAVTIRNGLSALDGGGILNGGTLAVSNSTVSGNLTRGWGGGVFNHGTLTVTNSTVSHNSAVDEILGLVGHGGGIYNSAATLTLSNSTISGNKAGGYGGGIYDVRGTLTITGSTVTRNRAEKFSGGGINSCCHSTAVIISSTISDNRAGSDGGGITSGGVNTLTVSDSTVSGNSAGSVGGGIVVTYGGALTVANSSVSGNTTGSHGGGIFNRGPATTVTMSNTTISDNSAAATGGGIGNNEILTVANSTISGNSAGAGGGGILNAYRATVDNSTIRANTAAFGGGILNGFDGVVTLSKSTVSGNIAGSGGGIANCPSSGLFGCGEATVNSSTISRNTAASDGGGVLNGGAMTLDNSTISGNSAGRGGGVFNAGSVLLASSTASGNRAEVGGGIFAESNSSGATLDSTVVANSPVGGNCGRAVVSAGYLVSAGYSVSSDATCFFGNIGDRNSTDPMLGPLTDNGGPTETHALQAGSPVIDRGHPGCPPPAVDQRGSPRPMDGDGDGNVACDIGAYEAGG